MSVFIEIVGWIFLACGAVAVVLTLLPLEAGRHARNQRHGRATSWREVWPDLRTFLATVAMGVSLLGHQWQPGTPGWWLPQVPLLAIIAWYLGTWIWSRTRGTPGPPEGESEMRNHLLAFAGVVSLAAYQWKMDTAGWWLVHVPVLVAGAMYLEFGVWYLVRRKSGGATAEPS